MNWIEVSSVEGLPEGERQVVEVGDKEILVLNHQGTIYALGNVCTHMGARMVKGKVTDEGTLVCPRHHTVFELETGEVVEWAPWPPVVGKVLGAVSQEEPLPSYETRVEEGTIFVGVEE
jgi:nitrite reductase/ring-hydroxylating ferredoxin subunit